MTNGDGSACTALAQGFYSFHFFPHLLVFASRQADTHPGLFPARDFFLFVSFLSS